MFRFALRFAVSLKVPTRSSGSRSLSSPHSRDRPRARLCRHRWGSLRTLVISSSLAVRPKLSPTITASTFEILCASYCKICETGCRCQRHRAEVGLGCRTETNGTNQHGLHKHNDVAEARTCWIRKSLSHNLLGHVDVTLPFCRSSGSIIS
jgi:hypothetical protein